MVLRSSLFLDTMKSRDLGSKLLDKVGLGMGGNTSDKDGIKDPGGTSGAKNNEKADYGAKDVAKNAITGEGFKTSFDKKDNADRKSTRLNSSHLRASRMPSSA